MHNRKLIALASAIFIAQPATAQVKKPVSASPCVRLAKQFNELEKTMASSSTADVLDNSAPRSQLRKLEINNSLLQIQIAIDLMKHNSCPLPDHAPTSATYFVASLACDTDTAKRPAVDTPSCNRDNWKANATSTD